MRFQISVSPDISQFIIQITGNRLIILDLVLRPTHLTGIQGNGISSDLKGYIKSVNAGKSFFESEELDTKDQF